MYAIILTDDLMDFGNLLHANYSQHLETLLQLDKLIECYRSLHSYMNNEVIRTFALSPYGELMRVKELIANCKKETNRVSLYVSTEECWQLKVDAIRLLNDINNEVNFVGYNLIQYTMHQVELENARREAAYIANGGADDVTAEE